jgi:hypothetical protein
VRLDRFTERAPIGSPEHTAQIAAIKAEHAARHAAWEQIVRARLEQGTATTHELGKLAGASSFSGFWNWLRQKQTVAVRAGRALGPTGHDNIVWALAEGEK